MDQLLSVGIDIGTSTTQLVVSRLTLENRGNPFSVPRIVIGEKEILYRSKVHFTPLKSDTVIDAEGVRAIVAEEYAAAGLRREAVDTGAVIITGETARKENAQEVVRSLAGFAGDFVVATAGPDLESILAARGAGVDERSRKERRNILHFDVGGGTSNLAFYSHGELQSTGCLDVGGRLIKLEPDGTVTYVSSKVADWCRENGVRIAVGVRATPELLAPVIRALTAALEEAAGLRPATDLLKRFITHKTAERNLPVEAVSFSGGVADCIWDGPEDWLRYGDIGVLLGREIAASDRFRQAGLLRGRETIRATVVGAGTHSTELSGSTVFYREVPFPMQNLPVLRLSEAEEQAGTDKLAQAIRQRLSWFSDQQGMTQLILSLRGERNPAFPRVQELAEAIAQGTRPLREAGYFPVVAVEGDMAKVLGQALALRVDGPLLCLDGVAGENGDYMDIGAPVAGGAVLPVVIKTLVFH